MEQIDEASMYGEIYKKYQSCRINFKLLFKKYKGSEDKQKEFEEMLNKNKEATDAIIKQFTELDEYLSKHAAGAETSSSDTPEDVIPMEPVQFMMNPATIHVPRINQTPFRVLYHLYSSETGTRYAYNGYRSRYNQFKKHLEKILDDRGIDSTIRENFINAQLALDTIAKTPYEIKKNTNIAFNLVDNNKECRVGKTKMAYEYLLRLKDFINQILPVDNPGAHPKQ